MSFGGSVKLTGESEYRKAIQNCISSLQSMSSALKTQTADFNSSDKAIKNTATAQKQLTDTIKAQQTELSKAKSSYASYQVALTAQTTKYNSLNKEYKNAVTELERIKKASGESSNEYQKQAQVVDKLEKELIQSTEAMNESKSAMASLKSEINNSNKTIKDAEKALNDLGNEAEDSGKQAQKGSDGFTVMKGVLANLASTGITAAINGLKKLGLAATSIGKQAVENYAEYEQLIGGVETLFKESSGAVQEYAAQAYKTAGISANKYMEQATSFSASLLQGLGGDTAKAAQIADMAIIDMSDNANKMGTSIEMLQNAYQAFAKDNFTLLDNLKLGYGGTAGEMARLINETGVLGDSMNVTAQTVKDVPFDKMIEAIHKVQEQMGITGTTSKEAASTIQGSVNSMKASWSNLLTAIADDNQDLSKAVDEFVDSAITASKNLVPRVKQVVEGIKKLISSLINEVFPKLKKEIPQLAPLIDTFNWFVKNKSLVVGAIQTMIAAFAINKILTFTKGLSDGAKALLEIAKSSAAATAAANINTAAQVTNTTAQVAGTAATGALTAATNLLNAAWAANPIGLLTIGITAAIGVFSLLRSKTDEATEAQKAQSKAIEEAAQKVKEANQTYDDLRNTQQKQIDAGMTEISHYQSLYDELQGIVDQNGKVKEGYEERANFITSTLSEALGIEIKNVDGVIQGYNNLKTSIDEVMEKKKAQIILDSQESLYKQAIEGQTEALKSMIETEDILTSRKIERKTLEDELAAATEKFVEITKKGTVEAWRAAAPISNQIEKIKQKMKTYDEETTRLKNIYNEQKGLLEKYAFDVGQYETNMALAHSGKYEEMSRVNWEYVKDYQATGDAEKAQLEDQVKNTETYLNILKELKAKTGSDIYDQQIKDNEKLLKEQQDSLLKYNATTEAELNKTTIIWSESLDEQLSEIVGAKVQFEEDGKGNVTAYIDGVASGEARSKEEMANIVTQTIAEISKQETGAETAGRNLIEGVNNGISNQDKQSGVFNTIASFGSKLLGRLKSSLQEHSPSKATEQMGVYLLEGLGNGINDEENGLFAQIEKSGKLILASLKETLQEYINLYEQKSTIAKETAEREFEALRQKTAEQMNILKNEAIKNITELRNTFKSQLSNLSNTIASYSRPVGENMALGIERGFNAQMPRIKANVVAQVKAIVDAAKAAMEINSPSKVWAEIGNYMAQGLGEGFTNEMANVTKEIQASLPTELDTGMVSVGNITSNENNSRYMEIDMVEAFKEALSEMKIELDDENMGKFIDKTVAKTIYS